MVFIGSFSACRAWRKTARLDPHRHRSFAVHGGVEFSRARRERALNGMGVYGKGGLSNHLTPPSQCPVYCCARRMAGDGHASTLVSGGPWGGRVLPSVGGRFPPCNGMGIHGNGGPPNHLTPPSHCHTCCMLGTHCSVQCRDPRVVAVAVQEDRPEHTCASDDRQQH